MIQITRNVNRQQLPLAKCQLRPAANILDVEIGCGVGWHPIEYARQNPDRHLVAIEHTAAKFARFQRRLENHQPLRNLTPVHENAIAWINACLGPATVDRYLLLYPNPNRGNKAKRWHCMPFMQVILETLKPGGEIWLASNERFYIEEARHFYEGHWGLRLIEERQLQAQDLALACTHFEKKYLAQGESCWHLRWQKAPSL